MAFDIDIKQQIMTRTPAKTINASSSPGVLESDVNLPIQSGIELTKARSLHVRLCTSFMHKLKRFVINFSTDNIQVYTIINK